MKTNPTHSSASRIIPKNSILQLLKSCEISNSHFSVDPNKNFGENFNLRHKVNFGLKAISGFRILVVLTALCFWAVSATGQQCGITNCTTHLQIVDLDATTGPIVVPLCTDGTIELNGDVQGNQSDCESAAGSRPTCPGAPPKDLNCFNWRIIRGNSSIYQQFTVKIGQGSGCNGNLDYASQVINGVCTQLACGGPGNIVTITFPVGINQVDVFGCTNSASSIHICNFCKQTPPCTSLPICNLNNVNILAGCQADVPPAYTMPSQVFTNIGTCSAMLRLTYVTTGDSLFCTAAYGVNFTRTYTLSFFDATQNQWFPYRTCTQTVVVGSPPPVAICQNITVALDPATNMATITAPQINNNSTGSCITLGASPTSFTCDNLGNNNVTLTVTDECGRSSQCVAVVTVTALAPTAMAGDDAEICAEATFTAVATATNGTILWTDGTSTGSFNGTETLEDATYDPSPADVLSGSVTLTMTVTGACGVTASDMVTITFKPSPSCNITGDDEVCTGTTGHQYNGTPGMSSYSWSVTGNGSLDGSTANPTVSGTAGSPGSLTLNLTITAANGCSATCEKEITILASPTCEITGEDEVCTGSMNNIYSAPGGMTGYTWSIDGDGTIMGSNTNQNVTVTAGAPGSFTLTLMITAPNTCTATCMKTVTVGAAPVCSITGPTTVCPASTNQYCSQNVADTYSWSVTGDATIDGSATGNCVDIIADLDCDGASYTVMLTMTSDGCTSMCSQVVNVVYSGGVIAPPNDNSTVSCPALAVNPGAPDDIVDACGLTISAGLIGSTTPPLCEGSVVWTYRYTGCDGTTTDDWTYTYTIDYSGGLNAPANDGDIVSCPAQAINPGPPANIFDACGRTVVPGLLGSTPPPACEGSVVWTYRYTACDGTTFDDWTFTYTINYSGGLDAPPNENLTVSCPDDADDPGAPDPILDECGRTVTAGLIGSTTPPVCEGPVVWTYRYTACDGTTFDDWTYTYNIDYSGGLNAPPNDGTVISCPGDATDPGAPDPIQDACGREVIAGLIGSTAPPVCEGSVVWTYRYTACDGSTFDDWTYTYTINYSGGLTAPDNDGEIVLCPADATNPGAPNILDDCGRVVSPGLLSVSGIPACEGSVVYTFRYTACDLTTFADWTYTYTIEYSGGLDAPPNDGEIISCPNEATNPGAPEDILDACGRTVTAGLIGSTTPPVCAGTVVWTYRYTACDGTTFDDWTYTYTITPSDGLEAPENDGEIVSCPDDATNPGTPPDILDACGRTVSAGLLSVSEIPACEGTVVYTFRYTACDNTTTVDWTYTYTINYSGGLETPGNDGEIVSCPDEATDPGAPVDILDACGRTVTAGLLSVSEVPSCEGSVVYTYRYTACDNTTTADWTYTYTIDYSGGLEAPDNESSTVSCPAQATDPGAPDDILDACGRTVSAGLLSSSVVPACEGTVIYTYRYTACDNTTTDDWTYTYTINYSGGLTAPDDDGSTVSCPALAVDPGAPTDILDACGRTVSAVLWNAGDPPVCEGTVQYLYLYLACDLTTFDVWTYTYTIDYSGGLTAPENDGDIVSCPADATLPGAPAPIQDACGRTVNAGLLSVSEIPACEGTVVYTFRYTSCDNTTTADWSYTYTIDYSGGLEAPDNETETVSCPDDADNPGAPDDILDACGRTVSAGFLSVSTVPECEGTVVWTYRYTACDLTTFDDWTYTYTIDYSGGLTAPDNETETVSCPDDAVDPGAPDDLLDACGRTVSA